MATWTVALPPDDTAAGDPGHPALHNLITDNLVEVRANVDLALPADDSRLTAGAAGVATVRALGTTGTTAAAGNDARLLTGTAPTIADVTVPFADLTAAATAHNALLAALRTRGILAP